MEQLKKKALFMSIRKIFVYYKKGAIVELPKNHTELKIYAAENYAKLSYETKLEVLRLFHKLIKKEAIVKEKLELEHEFLDEENAKKALSIREKPPFKRRMSISGDPRGTRTPVTAVKGRCPNR